MVQIPRYNRGLGPTVEMQAGQLAPRLGDFSQAVAAPYKVAGEVLGAVSEAAAAYEQKRQTTEFNRYEQQYYNLIDRESMEFVTTDVSRTPEEYRNNAKARFDKIITGIDDLKNIPSSVKSKLKTNVQFRLNNRLLEGEGNAFARQLEDDSKLYSDRIGTLLKDYAYSEGQSIEVGGGAPPIVKQTVIMNDMLEVVRQAKEEGLPFDLTEADLFLMGEAEKNNQIITLDNMPLYDVQKRFDDIRLGRDRFSGLSLEERENLASPLSAHITTLETTKVVQLQDSANDFISSMYIDPENRTEYYNQAMAVADSLDGLNRPDKAIEIRRLVNDMFTTISVVDDLALATPQQKLEFVQAQLSALDDLAGTPQAQEGLARVGLIQQTLQDQDKAIREDAGGYVYQHLLKKNKVAPTPAEMITAQAKMGLSVFELTPFRQQDLVNLKTELEGAGAAERLEITRRFLAPFSSLAPDGTVMSKTVTLPDGQVLDLNSLAMSKAIANGVISPSMNVALHTTPATALDILNAENVEDKTLTDAMDKPTIADLSKRVSENLEDWTKSIIGGGDGDALDQGATSGRINATIGIRDSVLKLAKVYHVVDNMSLSDAAEKATDVIMNSYVFEDVGNQTLRFPAHLAPIQDDLIGIMENKFTEQYLTGRIVVPEGQFGFRNVPAYAAELEYIKDVIKYGGWRTTDDDSGAFLVDKNGNEVRVSKDIYGKEVTAIDPVTGDDVVVGTRLEVNFQDGYRLLQAQEAMQFQLSDEAQQITSQVNELYIEMGNETDPKKKKEMYYQIRSLESERLILESWVNSGTVPVNAMSNGEEYFPD